MWGQVMSSTGTLFVILIYLCTSVINYMLQGLMAEQAYIRLECLCTSTFVPLMWTRQEHVYALHVRRKIALVVGKTKENCWFASRPVCALKVHLWKRCPIQGKDIGTGTCPLVMLMATWAVQL